MTLSVLWRNMRVWTNPLVFRCRYNSYPNRSYFWSKTRLLFYEWNKRITAVNRWTLQEETFSWREPVSPEAICGDVAYDNPESSRSDRQPVRNLSWNFQYSENLQDLLIATNLTTVALDQLHKTHLNSSDSFDFPSFESCSNSPGIKRYQLFFQLHFHGDICNWCRTN